MSRRPRISVLMTVFDAGPFLSAAVESILSQAGVDFEFVIVDDASTDGSTERLRAFAARDARVRLIHNEANRGQTASLNLGLRAARAEWIARQDADDLSLPGRLAEHLRLVAGDASLVVTGVNGWIVDERGAVTGMIHAPWQDAGIRWSMPFRNPFIHTGVAFRRRWPDGSAVQYDERFRICQDWELWSRLLVPGTAANSPRRLVAYRHRAASLSHGDADRTRAESDQVASEIWAREFPGRILQAPEMALLRSFRQGLAPEDRREFWRFYRQVARGWVDAAKIRQAVALHRFQAAGALVARDRVAAVADGVSSLFSSPRWMGRLLLDRARRPRAVGENFVSGGPSDR